jgi:hypothetical protein
MPKKKKSRVRAITWYVTISGRDPKDDYVTKVKAISIVDAYALVNPPSGSGRMISDIRPARPFKKRKTSAARKRH